MIDRFKLLNDWGVSEIILSENPNLTTEQIDLLYENKGIGSLDSNRLRVNLAQQSKLTVEQFMRFFNDEDFDKEYLARNPNLTPEQIDLLYDADVESQFYLSKHPKLSEEQFMRFFNNHPDKRIFLSSNPNLTPEQIDLLYESGNKKGGNPNLKINLSRYPKLSEEQFMRLLHDDDLAIKDRYKQQLSSNPHLTPEQIDLLYETRGASWGYTASHSNLTDEQFMRMFNYDGFNKNHLAQNPNLTPEQIDLLYQTEGVNKDNLASNPRLTDEQFLRAFNDGETDKNYLAMNPSINPVKQLFASGIFNWRW